MYQLRDRGGSVARYVKNDRDERIKKGGRYFEA